MLSKNAVEKDPFSILGKITLPMLSKKSLFRSTFPTQLFLSEFRSNPVGKVHVFPRDDGVKNAIEKGFQSDCAASLCHVSHTHTHHRHEQPRRMRACALVELVELVDLARSQIYTPGSTVGRVAYHSMAAAAGAAVDVSAVFAVTLAAYQQQQQRIMVVWNLIVDGYNDDTELDAENDESTKDIKRRRVYQRKDYKTSGWWQELQDEDLSDQTSRVPAILFS